MSTHKYWPVTSCGALAGMAVSAVSKTEVASSLLELKVQKDMGHGGGGGGGEW